MVEMDDFMAYDLIKWELVTMVRRSFEAKLPIFTAHAANSEALKHMLDEYIDLYCPEMHKERARRMEERIELAKELNESEVEIVPQNNKGRIGPAYRINIKGKTDDSKAQH